MQQYYNKQFINNNVLTILKRIQTHMHYCNNNSNLKRQNGKGASKNQVLTNKWKFL